MAQISKTMSWSRVRLAAAPTGANEAMATDLQELGTIKDKSTTLSMEAGEELVCKATGGITVAREVGEGTYSLTTRIIEPTFDEEGFLTGNTKSTDGKSMVVKTSIVNGDFSLKLTPKNIGATGIKVRRAHVTYVIGYSEEEGRYADVTFEFLACSDGEIFSWFEVEASDLTAGA